jgi:hypothetical protein
MRSSHSSPDMKTQPRARTGTYSNKKSGKVSLLVVSFLTVSILSAAGGGAFMSTHSVAKAEYVVVTKVGDNMPAEVKALKHESSVVYIRLRDTRIQGKRWTDHPRYQ